MNIDVNSTFRPESSITLHFALIRSQTGLSVFNYNIVMWPGIGYTKGRILENLTHQGAARIWHFSEYLNWLAVGQHQTGDESDIYSVSQIFFTPLGFSGNIVPNDWVFLTKILLAYSVFLSVQNYKLLFRYLQLWQSCAIWSVLV